MVWKTQELLYIQHVHEQVTKLFP